MQEAFWLRDEKMQVIPFNDKVIARSFLAMKNLILLVLTTHVFCFGFNSFVQAQNAPTEAVPKVGALPRTLGEQAQKEQVEKTLAILADPSVDYEAKSLALSEATALPPQLYNQVLRAAFLQGESSLSSHVSMILLENNNPNNVRLIRDNITEVRPTVQFHILNHLTERVGIQERSMELLFRQTALNVVRKYVEAPRVLTLEPSKALALAQACLLLSLSSAYSASEDGELMVKAAKVCQVPTLMSLALANRRLLTPALFAQLKRNGGSRFNSAVVLEVTSAEIDLNARKKLVNKLTVAAAKNYNDPKGVLNLDPGMDAIYFSLLRFINIPEKRNLLLKAFHSTSAPIKRASLLVATEDYPDLLLNKSIAPKSTKDTLEPREYEELIAYMVMKNPTYKRVVGKLVSASKFQYLVRDFRCGGIASVYFNSAGFNGI